MASRQRSLVARVYWNKPPLQNCMCRVCRSPVNSIHLVFERLEGCLDEVPRSTISSAAPNDIRGHAIIEFSDFSHNAFAFFRLREVCTNVVKPLLAGIGGGALKHQ